MSVSLTAADNVHGNDAIADILFRKITSVSSLRSVVLRQPEESEVFCISEAGERALCVVRHGE